MPEPPPVQCYRFGVFEADALTGELRRQGLRVKLNAQPFQVLAMLLERPGELLTRDEIARQLWPDGTFVDAEHGVNSAVNRIREALGDTARNPRFVETLARRGYRFVAPVERIALPPAPGSTRLTEQPLATPTAAASEPAAAHRPTGPARRLPRPRRSLLATADDLPQAPYRVVLTLFCLLQLMYLGFYVGALANLPEIRGLLGDLLGTGSACAALLQLITVGAAVLIPVRVFLLCAVLFQPPGLREKLLRLWPPLLAVDELWSLAPFLLLHHINFGLALACTAILVYAPFAQRSLILMGAARVPETGS